MSGEAVEVEAWLRVLPGGGRLIFWPPPERLYSVARLYAGFTPAEPATLDRAWDARVYAWTLGADDRPRSLNDVEMVATRLHDAAMDRLIRDYLDPTGPEATIGLMGGHDIPRADPAYPEIAAMARDLRRRGFKIVTGGGPGLMEAANLGAFLAPHPDAALVDVMRTLRAAPGFSPGRGEAALAEKRRWICAAAAVRQDLLGRWDAEPRPGGDSLGIPTWYYGHEPPNLFASCSAKYFMNSLREDGLVSLANGGLVFAKGAAGTVQEVFQNVGYNYYRGEGVEATPMAFLGADFWDPGRARVAAPDPKRKPVFPLVDKLGADADPPFAASLLISDDANEIVAFLIAQNAERAMARQADVRLAQPNAMPCPRRS